VTDNTERFPIQRITREGRQDTEDIVTAEMPFTIILNHRELVTLLCSPIDLNYLAIGFLASEGIITRREDIKKIIVDDRKGVAQVDTVEVKESAARLLPRRQITSSSGGGISFDRAAGVHGLAKVESRITISAPDILALVKEFQHRSVEFKATGGVHGAALCNTQSILLFSEDIGRHNALDKIFGKCILEGIPTADYIIITSGRISSEILLKVARREIPILISKSAPTSLGLKLAQDLNVTVIGFVRGDRMNVYTHGRRVVAFSK
jgi:FdhD protein